MSDIKLTLTLEETCKAIGLSRPLVTAFIKRQENPIPSIKTGKGYIIPRAALEQWVLEEAERNTNGKTGKAAKR